MNDDPWDYPLKGALSKEDKRKQHVQSRIGWAPKEDNKHFFVNDLEHPYVETKRFDWIRGYHVGGRSITWGKQSYRWSDLDFEANKKDGHGVDWPVRYKDIAPWYDKVEQYIGVSGQNLGLPHLPDGKFLAPMELNCVERDLQKSMSEKFSDGRYLPSEEPPILLQMKINLKEDKIANTEIVVLEDAPSAVISAVILLPFPLPRERAT